MANERRVWRRSCGLQVFESLGDEDASEFHAMEEIAETDMVLGILGGVPREDAPEWGRSPCEDEKCVLRTPAPSPIFDEVEPDGYLELRCKEVLREKSWRPSQEFGGEWSALEAFAAHRDWVECFRGEVGSVEATCNTFGVSITGCSIEVLGNGADKTVGFLTLTCSCCAHALGDLFGRCGYVPSGSGLSCESIPERFHRSLLCWGVNERVGTVS